MTAVWLCAANLVPSGDVVYFQDFVHQNPFISDLWPPDALGLKKDGVRAFVKDQVTFFIRPTRRFERAQVRLVAMHPQGLSGELLVQRTPGIADWVAIPWQLQQQEGRRHVYQATFALDHAWRAENGRFNLMFSLPGLQASGNVAGMDEMSVRFLGKPLSLSNVLALLYR